MNNQGNLLHRQPDENASVSTGAFHDDTIEDITRRADLIAHIQGLWFFEPFTKVGDRLIIDSRVMRKFANAALA
jgi:predicted RNA-binding protein with TRAM domain